MRIGTWNLAGRWTPAHHEFLDAMDCDVLLLTEVSERLELPGYAGRLSRELMAQRRRWAGVFSRSEMKPLPDPHPASAMARVDGLTFCSSILPWTSAGNRTPWIDGRHAAKTEHAVTALLGWLPPAGLVWGGDWNHSLVGRERAGSMAGRRFILDAVAGLGLHVPTTHLPHRIEGLLTIDHIGVPQEVEVLGAHRIVAEEADGKRLSDHDAYVVTVA